jgi:hypothetical protein
MDKLERIENDAVSDTSENRDRLEVEENVDMTATDALPTNIDEVVELKTNEEPLGPIPKITFPSPSKTRSSCFCKIP